MHQSSAEEEVRPGHGRTTKEFIDVPAGYLAKHWRGTSVPDDPDIHGVFWPLHGEGVIALWKYGSLVMALLQSLDHYFLVCLTYFGFVFKLCMGVFPAVLDLWQSMVMVSYDTTRLERRLTSKQRAAMKESSCQT